MIDEEAAGAVVGADWRPGAGQIFHQCPQSKYRCICAAARGQLAGRLTDLTPFITRPGGLSALLEFACVGQWS